MRLVGGTLERFPPDEVVIKSDHTVVAEIPRVR